MLKRCLIVVFALLTLCACQKEADFTETVMVGNPFTDHATLAQAEEAAQITLTLPEELAACEEIAYRSANSGDLQLIEVICTVDGEEVRIRKGIGEEDISGVYEEFEYTAKNEDGLVMKGKDNGYRLAIWQDGEYSYSIFCSKGMEFDNLYAWVYATK